MNSQKSVENTTSNTILKYETVVGKITYKVEVTKYERGENSNLQIEYNLFNHKGKPVVDVSEQLDFLLWQDIQFEMKGREHANRIF
mgnify:CR=1 FL=1